MLLVLLWTGVPTTSTTARTTLPLARVMKVTNHAFGIGLREQACLGSSNFRSRLNQRYVGGFSCLGGTRGTEDTLG